MYLDRGDSRAVAASWAGEPKHPIWYLNSLAHPEATIQVGDRHVPVRARELDGDERALVWKETVAQDPSFAVYEERTRGIREIPVVLLEPRGAASRKTQDGAQVLCGLGCSYFTGKLEAYLQTKGVPFHFVEMGTSQFQACGRATGLVQLPCIETPDGHGLTDTTAIMEHFEAQDAGPRVRPDDPATAFCTLLLEDLFDEWFWRPALYYRWAFDEDARLVSNQLARAMSGDVSLPLFLRRRFALHRQRIVYLKKDGGTDANACAPGGPLGHATVKDDAGRRRLLLRDGRERPSALPGGERARGRRTLGEREVPRAGRRVAAGTNDHRRDEYGSARSPRPIGTTGCSLRLKSNDFPH
jgi:deazaflavin-dependent oxidoreductase (nitroreductase family)